MGCFAEWALSATLRYWVHFFPQRRRPVSQEGCHLFAAAPGFFHPQKPPLTYFSPRRTRISQHLQRWVSWTFLGKRSPPGRLRNFRLLGKSGAQREKKGKEAGRLREVTGRAAETEGRARPLVAPVSAPRASSWRSEGSRRKLLPAPVAPGQISLSLRSAPA